jgi:hypothetical protein
MNKVNVDPSLLEGEDLERWYRRPLGQVAAEREAERRRRHREFFGRFPDAEDGDAYGSSDAGQEVGGWQEARAPIAPTIRPAPVETQVGAPQRAGVPVGEVQGGFFDRRAPVSNPLHGPAYYTDLPRPLNVVTSRFGGWFQLGDGTLVQGADEVERIHAEQQRRMRGEDEPEPAPRAKVRDVDRFQDGIIPSASHLEKGERELDPTCHPNGGWEVEPGYSKRAKRTNDYEAQIARAPGLDYVVRNPLENAVRFDGCAVWDPRRQLLEAKGPGYAGLVERGRRSTFFPLLRMGPEGQARRQARASRGRPVDWHVAEPDALPFFRDVLEPYPINLHHTPAK